MVYDIGPDLESIRVPKEDGIVFSWRFLPTEHGQLFDSDYRWHHFNSRCLELAEAPSCRWVVVADIADFFPHVYFHPLEHALDVATRRSDKAYCILRFVRNWNGFVSYGVPVGLAGSRLLAEASITGIDDALIGLGRRYCRYSDDIRIFCRSEGDAKRALEQLANILFETHGLTLQPMKTLTVSKAEYLRRFATSGERAELENLTDRLSQLLTAAGFEDDYDDEVEYDNLPDETREEIDRLNLVEVLQQQVLADQPDTVVTRFLLYRLTQLGIDEGAQTVLANLSKLGHVIDSVVAYLSSLRSLSATTRRNIGRRVIAAARRPTTGSYERMCLLSLFTHTAEFDNEERFSRLHEQFRDAPTQRELILALGRAAAESWFITRRRDYQALEPWSRRAFLAAFSCVNRDARSPFYRSLRNGSDILERSIIEWASDHPFA